MSYQHHFQRYEVKYILNPAQKEALKRAMAAHMRPDKFARASIRNIYYDTEDFRLIRRSLEKPVYKEKLRFRRYDGMDSDVEAFLEIKKKFRGVVYKRRLLLPYEETCHSISAQMRIDASGQIAEEINYLLKYYGQLRPAMWISYEREAYASRDGNEFRLTLDTRLMYRREALDLRAEAYGNMLLPKDSTLLELKIPGAMPLWMSRFLTEQGIYKCSFSKYGTAYLNELAAHRVFVGQKETAGQSRLVSQGECVSQSRLVSQGECVSQSRLVSQGECASQNGVVSQSRLISQSGSVEKNAVKKQAASGKEENQSGEKGEKSYERIAV